ncbi:MAG TPA: YceI family protein [Blastocatellia bacterium]|nr:YceI family protein [Blastocatellia bacterium]
MIKKLLTVAFLLAFTAASVMAAVLNYGVDTAHSTVGFSVPILGGLSKVTGKFTDFTVNIAYDEADITKSSVRATIKTASINTGIQRRDDHLRTADFFDAEKYPEITFQSKRIEKKGDKLFAIGDLSMHGVTKEVTLPFSISGVNKGQSGPPTYGFSARMPLNRIDFGISYKRRDNPAFIGDIVEVQINVLTRVERKKE